MPRFGQQLGRLLDRMGRENAPAPIPYAATRRPSHHHAVLPDPAAKTAGRTEISHETPDLILPCVILRCHDYWARDGVRAAVRRPGTHSQHFRQGRVGRAVLEEVH